MFDNFATTFSGRTIAKQQYLVQLTKTVHAKIVINVVWTFTCVTCTLFYSLELISFKPVIIKQQIRIIMYINVRMT